MIERREFIAGAVAAAVVPPSLALGDSFTHERKKAVEALFALLRSKGGALTIGEISMKLEPGPAAVIRSRAGAIRITLSDSEVIEA
jgi:hypothetical protein